MDVKQQQQHSFTHDKIVPYFGSGSSFPCTTRDWKSKSIVRALSDVCLVIRRLQVRYLGPAPFFRWDWSWNIFCGHFSPFYRFKKGSCHLMAKECEEWVVVNCLVDLSHPRESVVRLTDHPDMTLGCSPWTLKNITQSRIQPPCLGLFWWFLYLFG